MDNKDLKLTNFIGKIEILYTKKFGRGIYATEDIEKFQIIFIDEILIGAYTKEHFE